MQRIMFLGLPVDIVPDASAVAETIRSHMAERRPMAVTFVNPHSFHLARDADVRTAFHRFDLVLPDGIGVVWALRWGRRLRPSRVSFDATSLYGPLFRRLDQAGARVFVVGAAPGVALGAVARMATIYRRVAFVDVRDGYGETGRLCEEILSADPDLVLCGLGAPLQERFALSLRDAGYRGIVCTCGGFLDQLAQGERYYPAWVDRLDLRWAYRLRREPRRLWRRYLLLYPPFFFRAFVNGLGWRLGLR